MFNNIEKHLEKNGKRSFEAQQEAPQIGILKNANGNEQLSSLHYPTRAYVFLPDKESCYLEPKDLLRVSCI